MYILRSTFNYLFLAGMPCIITDRPKNTNWPNNWACVSLPIADNDLAPCIEPNRKLQSPYRKFPVSLLFHGSQISYKFELSHGKSKPPSTGFYYRIINK